MIEQNKLKAEDFEKQLEDALTFLKNLIANYQLLKKQVFGMIQIKNSQNEYQRNLIGSISRYEDKSHQLFKGFVQDYTYSPAEGTNEQE